MTGKQVLLIEDEPNIIEAIRFILSRDGWSVATHSDGTTALDKVQSVAPDLIILDVMLPGRSGYDILRDLRAHDCNMLTLGQYLQPSVHHLPLDRYVHPDEFDRLGELGYELGFTHVASGPMVRSSYHADQQAREAMEQD